MLKNLSIAKKIGGGFGAIVLLLGVVAVWSILSFGDVEHAIEGSNIGNEVMQREVDLLNWAGRVSTLLTDENVIELNVQTDPHKCAFGRWYYGDERKKAENLIPGLKPIFAQIEDPHKRLHESAVYIGEVYVQVDVEIGSFLREKKADHLLWAHHVKDAFLHRGTDLDVELDPTQCSLGKWLNSPEVAALKGKYPEFAALLVGIEGPHRKLHESARHIRDLISAGQDEEGLAYYFEETEPAAHHTLQEINKVIAWHNGNLAGARKAGEIYTTVTTPALKEVQELLRKATEAVYEKVMTNDEVLQAAGHTKTIVTALSVVAGIIGILVAFLIARGIVRALKTEIGALTQGSDQVSSASSQVASSSQQMAEGASEQASSLEEISASLQEMGSLSRQNADNAKEANNLAASGATEAEKGNEAVGRMSKAIEDIKKSSDETAKIIRTIDEIAFQTNLLALNAAVEAARAGEAGKGFAVVAEEVRNLAQRSAEAARNTSNLIEESQKNADNGVQVSQEVASSLSSIVTSIQKVTGLVNEISAASDEQAKGVDQINQAMSQMDKVTQENASNAEESASAAEELNAQAQELKVVVQQLQEIVGGRGSTVGTGAAAGTGKEWKKDKTTWDEKKVHGMKDRIHALAHKGESYTHDQPGNIKRTARQGKPEELIPLEEADFKDA